MQTRKVSLESAVTHGAPFLVRSVHFHLCHSSQIWAKLLRNNGGDVMTILQWPVSERPRQKMQERGPSALSDAELLAVMIGSGIKGQSAVDVGRELLKKFGSIRQFLNADRDLCLQQSGIGPTRLLMLQAALELARRHYLDELRLGPGLSDSATANQYLISRLRDLPYEVFCCLHLNRQRQLIAFEELFRGTLDAAHVHVREVVRQVMVHNSVSVIFAHNHPSGVADPSNADIEMTQLLRSVLSAVNVQVLDHVVVGDGECASFLQLGIL